MAATMGAEEIIKVYKDKLLFSSFPDRIQANDQQARKAPPLKQDKKNKIIETAVFGKEKNAPGPSGDPERQVRYLNLAQVEPGRIVNGRYRVDRLIGRGGFGMVFAGFDLTLKTSVALKFFNPTSLRDEKKFLRVQREINLSRKIGDARIIRIFSLENWSGIWFMVMELIESKTLRELLKEKGRFSWEEFRPIFLEILQGVESLHDQGIIHRDLKPSNITMDANGKIKILDFGLAKEIGDLEITSSIGEIVGSPFYLSPEQIQNRELGVESDIYQLGILLFQALTGACPFADTSTLGLVLMHLNREPGRIQDLGIQVPRVVEFVVAKALAKKKQDRFHSSAEMAERLHQDSVPLLHSLARHFPRTWRLIAAMAAMLLIAIGVYWQALGSKAIHSLETSKTVVRAQNRFGMTVWKKDFSPFTVHLAYIAKKTRPWERQGEQNPVNNVKLSFLSNLQDQPSPLTVVFLSHPGKGIFAGDCSVNSNHIDNQLAILDPGGKLHGQGPYGKTFNLTAFDFAPVFSMANFKKLEFGKDENNLVLFEFQNFQGMYPSALVVNQGSSFSVLCSPGSIRETRVLKSTTSGTSLLVLGHNNLVSHLAYLTEWNISPASGRHWEIIPSYNQEPKNAASDFLAFVPPDTRIIENNWLNVGTVVLLDKREQEAITVHRDGTLKVKRNGQDLVFRDIPETLARAYGLIDECIRQKTIHHNPEKALERIDKALSLKVENPYLRSALLYLKGDCETAMGRYGTGKESLQGALRYFPRNNDAMQRLLEIVFFEQGPLAAIETMEQSFSQGRNFFGLGNVGMRLFLGNFHLAAGQMEKAREYYEKIYQENFPYAQNSLSGILDMFKGNYAQAYRYLHQGEGQPPAIFIVREYRLLLARSMVLAQTEPARARWILEDLAKFSLRQGHMTEVSLCYLLAREGKFAEARERIGPAFEKLKKMAAGDAETRLWFWYDAFIYARTMELLGNPRAAREGYRACLEANPHTALAAEARQALARGKQRGTAGTGSAAPNK
ncbi:MAG: protein kinase [Candidatus Aminicenantes bacterium]|nr:protein kinase [Candidatus Aminicenantes bacterium]